MDCKYSKENDGIIIDLIVIDKLFNGNTAEDIMGAVDLYLQSNYGGSNYKDISPNIVEHSSILKDIYARMLDLTQSAKPNAKDLTFALSRLMNDKLAKFGYDIAEPTVNLSTGKISIESKSNYADLDATVLKSSNILNVFAKNEAAVNAFKSKLTVDLLTNCIVNLKNKTIAATDIELNDRLLNLRKDIFNKLLKYAINKNIIKIDDKGSHVYTESNISNLISKMIDFHRTSDNILDNSRINSFMNDTTSSDNIDNLFNLISLKYFDDVLGSATGNLVSIAPVYHNVFSNISGVTKYKFGETSRMIGGWGEEDNTHETVTTGIVDILIDFTPLISETGEIVQNTYIKKDQFISVIAKLRQKVSRLKTLNGLQEAIEQIVLRKLDGSINVNKSLTVIADKFSDAEINVLRSIYTKFFYNRSSSNVKTLKGRKSTKAFFSNIESNSMHSFYEVYSDSNNRKGSKLSLLDAVVSTISKDVPNVMSDVTITSDGTLLSQVLSDKPIDKYVSTIKTALMSRADSKVNLSVENEVEIQFNENGNDFVTLNESNNNSLKTTSKVKIIFKSLINAGEDITFDLSSTPKGIEGINYDLNDIFAKAITNNNLTERQNNALYLLARITGIQLINNDYTNLKYLIKSNPKTFITDILNLAGNVLISREIVTVCNNDRNTIKEFVKSFNGVVDTSKTNISNIYNTKLNRIVPVFNNEVALRLIEPLAQSQAINSGDLSRAVVADASGKKQAAYNLLNRISDIETIIDRVKTAGVDNNPLADNVFVNNPELLKDVVVRTYVKTMDKTIHASKISTADTVYHDIVFDFLQNLNNLDQKNKMKGTFLFQPHVYSDKKKLPSIRIDGSVILNYKGLDGLANTSKTFAQMTTTDHALLHFQTQHKYYKNLAKNLYEINESIINELINQYKTDPESIKTNILKSFKYLPEFIGKVSESEILNDAVISKEYKKYSGIIEFLNNSVTLGSMQSMTKPTDINKMNSIMNMIPNEFYNKFAREHVIHDSNIELIEGFAFKKAPDGTTTFGLSVLDFMNRFLYFDDKHSEITDDLIRLYSRDNVSIPEGVKLIKTGNEITSIQFKLSNGKTNELSLTDPLFNDSLLKKVIEDKEYSISFKKDKIDKVSFNDNSAITNMGAIENDSISIRYQMKMTTAKRKFIDSMTKLDLNFDLYNKNGKPNKALHSDTMMDSDHGFYNKQTERILAVNNKGQLHPELEKYFWAHKITEPFNQLVVGSIHQYGKDAKYNAKASEDDMVEEEVANRVVAMVKRMVQYQSTIHPYNMNLKNGVPFFYRMATFEEPEEDISNPQGMIQKVDPLNGMSYNTGIARIWENRSLVDQAGGINHKSIRMSMNQKFGVAELLKHAAFTIGNEDERNGDNFKTVNMKMLRGTKANFNINGKVYSDFAVNIEGHPINVNFAKEFDGSKLIDFRSIDGVSGGLYRSKSGKIDKIDEILGLENVIDDMKYYSAEDGTGAIIPLTTENIQLMLDGQLFGSITRNDGINNIPILGTVNNLMMLFNLSQDKLTNKIYNLKLKDILGNVVYEPVIIHNVYDLREALGGCWSMTENKNGGTSAYIGDTQVKLSWRNPNSPCDAVDHVVAYITDNVGSYRTTEGLSTYFNDLAANGVTLSPDNEENYRTYFTNRLMGDIEYYAKNKDIKNKVLDQHLLFQPLKDHVISYIAFTSAQKTGVINLNTLEKLTDDSEWNISHKEDVTWFGIQLDPDHEIDESTVTEMTQTITSLIFDLETPDFAYGTYMTISKFVENKVRDHLANYLSGDPNKINDSNMKIFRPIVTNNIKDFEDSLAYEVMKKAHNELNKGNFIFPMSSPDIYKKLFAEIASQFKKELIRRKPAGGAAVIEGSKDMVKFRDLPVIDETGRIIKTIPVTGDVYESKYNELMSKFQEINPDENAFVNLFRIPLGQSFIVDEFGISNRDKNEIENTLSNIEIGDVIELLNEDGTNKIIEVEQPLDLIKIEREFSKGFFHVTKLLNHSRNLKPENIKWSIGSKKMSLHNNFITRSALIENQFYNELKSIESLQKELSNTQTQLTQSMLLQQSIHNKINKIENRLYQDSEIYEKYLQPEVYALYFSMDKFPPTEINMVDINGNPGFMTREIFNDIFEYKTAVIYNRLIENINKNGIVAELKC